MGNKTIFRWLLTTECAKNYRNRTVIVQAIVEKCSRMFFFRDSVVFSTCTIWTLNVFQTGHKRDIITINGGGGTPRWARTETVVLADCTKGRAYDTTLRVCRRWRYVGLLWYKRSFHASKRHVSANVVTSQVITLNIFISFFFSTPSSLNFTTSQTISRFPETVSPSKLRTRLLKACR